MRKNKMFVDILTDMFGKQHIVTMEDLDSPEEKEDTSFYHVTREGQRMKLSDMTDSHLKNTIALIERKASSGITISNGGGNGPEEYWFEQYTISGQEALEHLNYSKYMDELASRRKS